MVRTRDRAFVGLVIGLLAAPTAWSDRAPAVEEALRRAEESAARYPAERYDLDAFAPTLGPGIEPAFRFVRDSVRFESYPGVLRGARIAFTSRAANSFDRSLLLANLLGRVGVETRFALGRLAPERASVLFDRMFAPRAREPGRTGPPGSTLARGTGGLLERVSARAARDWAAVKAALGSSWPSGSLDPAAVKEEIREHAWVQAKVDGKWVDLDTAFPDAEPGSAFADAPATMAEFPDDRWQRVTIRVRAETWTGSDLSSSIALETTQSAAALLDRDVYLCHVEGGSGGVGKALGAGIVAGGKDVWSPVLWTSDRVIQGEPIAFTDSTAAPARGVPPRGGMPFGPGGALSASQQLVAEWLEVEMHSPGRGPVVTTRALLDRAPQGWRAARPLDPGRLLPITRNQGVPTTPGELHDLRFTAGGHDLHAFAQAVLALARYAPEDGSTAIAHPDLPMDVKLWPFAVQNFGVVLASDHHVVPAVNDSDDYLLYADSPRLLVFTGGMDPGRGRFLDVDLRRDSLRGVSRTAAGARGVVERKVWFGLLEGALEHETGVPLVEGASVTGFTSVVSTTGALADVPLRAAGAGIPVPEAWRDAGLAAAIEADLRSGHVAVGPESPRKGLAAWWRISPDGTTTAVLGGLHARGTGQRPPGSPPQPQVPDPSRTQRWGTPGEPPRSIGPQNPGGTPNPDYGRPSGGRGGAGGGGGGGGGRPPAPTGGARARPRDNPGGQETMAVTKGITVEVVFGLVLQYLPEIMFAVAALVATYIGFMLTG